VNPLVSVPLCPLVLVTTTSTVPAAWAGVVAVIDVLLATVTPVAAVPPKVTVSPAAKFVPVMVTPVPPLVGPELGETEPTVGAGVPPEPEALKVAICITQLPLDDSGAVAE
jgi:hypothetical protein